MLGIQHIKKRLNDIATLFKAEHVNVRIDTLTGTPGRQTWSGDSFKWSLWTFSANWSLTFGGAHTISKENLGVQIETCHVRGMRLISSQSFVDSVSHVPDHVPHENSISEHLKSGDFSISAHNKLSNSSWENRIFNDPEGAQLNQAQKLYCWRIPLHKIKYIQSLQPELQMLHHVIDRCMMDQLNPPPWKRNPDVHHAPMHNITKNGPNMHTNIIWSDLIISGAPVLKFTDPLRPCNDTQHFEGSE